MDVTSIIERKRAANFKRVPVLTLLRKHPFRTAAAALTGLVVGVMGWGVAVFVRHVIDHTQDLGRLHLLALGVAFVLVLRGLISLVRRSLQVHLARRIETDLADRYVDHVTRLEMRFYEKYNTGDLLSRLKGIEVLRNALEDRFLGVTFDAVLVVIAAAIMVRHSAALAILATVGAALPGLIIVAIRQSIKGSFDTLRQKEGELSDHCMDALIGVRDLRLTEGESWLVQRIKSSYRSFQDLRIRHIMKLTRLGAVIGLISSLAGIAVLVLGARSVQQGNLTAGQLMFLFTMAGTMLGPLEQLASTWISFDEASVAFARYNEILLLPAEPRGAEQAAGASLKGDIELDRVSFGYRAGRRILDEVSMKIPAGSSLSIVGESGAGKSTLLSLLAGLYLPDEGQIRVDGRPIQDLGIVRIRREIGVVFQTPHLFDATIDENIRMGRWEASEAEVRQAAERARAHDFIDRLPQKYQTLVSRSGASFSGGQVQRVAIARALVCDPRILLLDEATGNLDAHTESAIWTTLTDASLRCTRVFITHRLSTTARMDRIVVLERGAIAESGSFKELMSQQGAFYRLWRRQMAHESAA